MPVELYILSTKSSPDSPSSDHSSLDSPSSDHSSSGSSHSSKEVTHETTSRESDYDQTKYDKEGREKYGISGTRHEKTKSRTIVDRGSNEDNPLRSIKTSVRKNEKNKSTTTTGNGTIIVDNSRSRVKTSRTTMFGRSRDRKSGSVPSSQETSYNSSKPSSPLSALLEGIGMLDNSSELSRSKGTKRSQNRGHTIWRNPLN